MLFFNFSQNSSKELQQRYKTNLKQLGFVYANLGFICTLIKTFNKL